MSDFLFLKSEKGIGGGGADDGLTVFEKWEDEIGLLLRIGSEHAKTEGAPVAFDGVSRVDGGFQKWEVLRIPFASDKGDFSDFFKIECRALGEAGDGGGSGESFEQWLGDEAGVTGFDHGGFQLFAEGGKFLGVCGIGGEIVHLPRIGGQVVKLLGNFRGFPESLVGVTEFAFLPSFLISDPAGLAKLIEGVGRKGEVGIEVADVFPFAVGQAAAHSVELVEAVREKKFHFIGRGFDALGAKEGATLDVFGDIDFCQRKKGGSEIHEGDGFGDALAGLEGREMLEFFRNTDEQGNFDTGFLEIAFSAWQDATMIRVVENNGILREFGCFELRKDFTDFLVHGGDAVMVAGEVFSDFREVGKVRREVNFIRFEALGFRRAI